MQQLTLALDTIRDEAVKRLGGEAREMPFRDLAELRAIAASLDTAEPITPVKVGELEFPNHKGLRWTGSGKKITVVSKGFRIDQNRDALLQVCDTVDAMGLQPRGIVCETEDGHMLAKVFIQNPEYELHVALGEVRQDTYITLGVGLENSYGSPHVSLRAEAIGYAPANDQLLYFPRMIGKHAFRHWGSKEAQRRIGATISLLTQRAPAAGRRIEEASTTQIHGDDDAVALLRAVGIPTKTATDIVTAGASHTHYWSDPVTAWGLYNAVLSAYSQRKLTRAGRDDVCRRLENILVVDGLPALIAKGHQLVVKDRTKADVEDLEAVLEAEPALGDR
jgi:hypothetical protein